MDGLYDLYGEIPSRNGWFIRYPYRKSPRTQPGVVSFHPIFGSVWGGQSRTAMRGFPKRALSCQMDMVNIWCLVLMVFMPIYVHLGWYDEYDEMFCLLKTKPVINHEYIGMIRDLQHATGDHVLSMPFPSESGCSFPSNQPEWPGGSMGKSYCHGCGPGESVPASGKPHKKTVVAMPM